jgi:hypothetical protein
MTVAEGAEDGDRAVRKITFRGTSDEFSGLLRILAEHDVDAVVLEDNVP